MTNSMVITVPGNPIAKARPRFFRRGKGVGTYNVQGALEDQFKWNLWTSRTIQDPIPSGTAIRLFCRFFMPIPASASKKQKELMAGSAVPHIKRPDLDNLVKFVKDCANGVLWYDDSQIISLTASKAYHPEPQTEIRIEW